MNRITPLTLIGEYTGDDWLDLAKPNILDRMAAYEEDQIEFSILGVVQDPLPSLIQQLATNVRRLEIINDHLMSHPGTNASLHKTVLDETVLGPDASFGLTRAGIDAAVISESIQGECRAFSIEQLQQHQRALGDGQRELRIRIREEQQTQRADKDHATGRRYDYGPAVRTWLQFLARKQVLAELLQ